MVQLLIIRNQLTMFLWISNVFLPLFFPCFPCFSHVSCGFPMVYQGFSHAFPMVFPTLFSCFPCFFPCFFTCSHGCPMAFPHSVLKRQRWGHPHQSERLPTELAVRMASWRCRALQSQRAATVTQPWDSHFGIRCIWYMNTRWCPIQYLVYRGKSQNMYKMGPPRYVNVGL